jgi:hypothetical protein
MAARLPPRAPCPALHPPPPAAQVPLALVILTSPAFYQGSNRMLYSTDFSTLVMAISAGGWARPAVGGGPTSRRRVGPPAGAAALCRAGPPLVWTGRRPPCARNLPRPRPKPAHAPLARPRYPQPTIRPPIPQPQPPHPPPKAISRTTRSSASCATSTRAQSS